MSGGRPLFGAGGGRGTGTGYEMPLGPQRNIVSAADDARLRHDPFRGANGAIDGGSGPQRRIVSAEEDARLRHDPFGGANGAAGGGNGDSDQDGVDENGMHYRLKKNGHRIYDNGDEVWKDKSGHLIWKKTDGEMFTQDSNGQWIPNQSGGYGNGNNYGSVNPNPLTGDMDAHGGGYMNNVEKTENLSHLRNKLYEYNNALKEHGQKELSPDEIDKIVAAGGKWDNGSSELARVQRGLDILNGSDIGTNKGHQVMLDALNNHLKNAAKGDFNDKHVNFAGEFDKMDDEDRDGKLDKTAGKHAAKMNTDHVRHKYDLHLDEKPKEDKKEEKLTLASNNTGTGTPTPAPSMSPAPSPAPSPSPDPVETASASPTPHPFAHLMKQGAESSVNWNQDNPQHLHFEDKQSAQLPAVIIKDDKSASVDTGLSAGGP